MAYYDSDRPANRTNSHRYKHTHSSNRPRKPTCAHWDLPATKIPPRTNQYYQIYSHAILHMHYHVGNNRTEMGGYLQGKPRYGKKSNIPSDVLMTRCSILTGCTAEAVSTMHDFSKVSMKMIRDLKIVSFRCTAARHVRCPGTGLPNNS